MSIISSSLDIEFIVWDGQPSTRKDIDAFIGSRYETKTSNLDNSNLRLRSLDTAQVEPLIVGTCVCKLPSGRVIVISNPNQKVDDL